MVIGVATIFAVDYLAQISIFGRPSKLGRWPEKQVVFFVSASECRDTVLGARMYVRTSSEARAETTWIELPSHTPSNMLNQKVMLAVLLACMLSAEADHTRCMRERYRR